MQTLIVQPKTQKQLAALVAVLKALNIDFKKEDGVSPYNSEFVKKIKASEKKFKEGKYTIIKVENLWK